VEDIGGHSDTDIPKLSTMSWWHSGSADFTSTKWNPCCSSFRVSSNLYQGNPDWSRKLWNIVSSEKYILHIQVLLEWCYV
jgi:hypothetical protein